MQQRDVPSGGILAQAKVNKSFCFFFQKEVFFFEKKNQKTFVNLAFLL